MNFLAIDTTMGEIAIAISINGKDTAKIIPTDSMKKHNSMLLSSIEKLLKENNCEIGCIDVFGVINGPGSFTGIRIGVASINAMAKVLNKKVVEISSFQQARINNEENDILALIDCKHNNFYSALYTKSDVEYIELTKKEIDQMNVKKIYIKKPNPKALLETMKKEIEKHNFVQRAKPFYMKKSSAEIENGRK